MATKTCNKKAAVAAKKGFGAGPEPRLGTGYSRNYTHALYAVLRKQTGIGDVNDLVAMMRADEAQDAKPVQRVTRKAVFTPEHTKEVFRFKREQGGQTHELFTLGFWQVAISVTKGPDRKRPVFAVNTWVGEGGWMHHADQIEASIVTSLGRETYDAWRREVFEDWSSLVAVMHAACEWLSLRGYAYAWSWSSSERSQKFLRKLGIRTTYEGVVMLFPHYGEDLFDLRDKTPVLDKGEAMLAAGKTHQEIMRALVFGQER